MRKRRRERGENHSCTRNKRDAREDAWHVMIMRGAPAISRRLRFLTVCVTPFPRAALPARRNTVSIRSPGRCVSTVIDGKLNSIMIHVRRDSTSQVCIRHRPPPAFSAPADPSESIFPSRFDAEIRSRLSLQQIRFIAKNI